MCDDVGYVFCSFLKDFSWEFIWASSFILVEIFQLFKLSRLCQYQEWACWGTMKDLSPEWCISFAGEYRGNLVVEGICLIAVVCDWFIIHSQDGNANVCSFVCLDE